MEAAVACQHADCIARSLPSAFRRHCSQVLRVSGAPKQQRAAAKLIQLVARPHWLLCTLLLCNAACMEALPLFLDRLLNPLAAILLRCGVRVQPGMQPAGALARRYAQPHAIRGCQARVMTATRCFARRLTAGCARLHFSVTAILLFGEIIPQAVCSR